MGGEGLNLVKDEDALCDVMQLPAWLCPVSKEAFK
jgi:hypothetical protein